MNDSKRSEGESKLDSKRISVEGNKNEDRRGSDRNRNDVKSRDRSDNNHKKTVEKSNDDRKFKDVRELLNGGSSRVVSVVSNDGTQLANRTTKKTKKY